LMRIFLKYLLYIFYR